MKQAWKHASGQYDKGDGKKKKNTRVNNQIVLVVKQILSVSYITSRNNCIVSYSTRFTIAKHAATLCVQRLHWKQATTSLLTNCLQMWFVLSVYQQAAGGKCQRCYIIHVSSIKKEKQIYIKLWSSKPNMSLTSQQHLSCPLAGRRRSPWHAAL